MGYSLNLSSPYIALEKPVSLLLFFNSILLVYNLQVVNNQFELLIFFTATEYMDHLIKIKSVDTSCCESRCFLLRSGSIPVQFHQFLVRK